MDELRIARPELAEVSLTYAGRLDPMASGTLLVLVGDECKNREKYLGLDKEYKFEVLLGIETDTGDILGMPKVAVLAHSYHEAEIHTAVLSLIGSHSLPSPSYSSRTVAGKPLFKYAHGGELAAVTIPTADMKVHDITLNSIRSLSHKALMQSIVRRIERFDPVIDPSRPESDFRKDTIIAEWKALHDAMHGTSIIISCTAHVSSGTYIRTLSSLLARHLGTVGLAHRIHRTKIHLPLDTSGSR